MYMKKGFTLIELLAVIVILAIIALIAIPMILHLIEESRLSSTEISMENIENAAKLYYYNKEIDENFKDITFTCNNGVCRNQNETLTLKGNAPEDGKIKINSKGNVTFTPMIMNGYVCVKEGTFKCFKAKSDEIVSEDGIITINETRQYLSNYRIYGNSLQDSVPTPDSPQEIKSVGDLVTDETSPNYGKYETRQTCKSTR